jgi:putative drug exporter of the RND superfamily
VTTAQHRTDEGSERAETPVRRSRWRWLLPAAVVLVWLFVGGPLGSFTGRLAEVQSNDNATFLPSDAESTRVAELQERFQEQATLPAIVVWENVDGIEASTQQAAAEDVQAIASIEGVVGEPTPPIPSEDGQALQSIVLLDADLGDGLVDVVEQMRQQVADTSGAEVYVAGPGGVLADFVVAFEGIDGILLLTAAVVVLLILLVVYRSPVLPIVVLISALLALGVAAACVYVLADNDVITLNGQSQGILFILVVGAATDYALLLTARYREELRENRDRFAAMRVALRQSVQPIVASGSTVILGVLCLLFSELNSNRGLGPVGAIGVVFAVVSALTFLPAVLVLLGRAAFWPFRPAYGSAHPETTGIWGRVARLVGRRSRPLWIVTTLALAGLAAFAPTLHAEGISETDLFLRPQESVAGQAAIARHFPAGVGTPTVIIATEDQVDDVVRVAEGLDGVDVTAPLTESGQPGQGPAKVVDGLVQIDALLTDPSDSDGAIATVRELRAALDDVDGDPVLVGGQTATNLDVRESSLRDRNTIIPIVLVVIFAVLVLLLRALVAPLLLIATVVLSFAATLGVASLVFEYVFDWPGADPSIPLFAFVFLVALGIDYNIFLMTRIREESFRRGTRPGILKGLAVTGGVITSAGIVLAATFSALGVIPILFLGQIAFLVAFGVLLDTIVVRSLLVPALGYDIGPRIWWPSKLARRGEPQEARAPELADVGS